MFAQQHQHQHQMMKGKRTKRSRTASPLALAMTTSGEESCRVATSSSTTTTTTTANVESGAHICNSSPTPTPTVTEEEEDMANCLILLAQGKSKIQKLTHTQQELESPAAVTAVSAARTPAANAGAAPGMFVYECKTCSRCFPSFQALGGHRASHRKPKLPATALSLADDHQRHQDYFQSAENSKINKAEELGLSLQIACNSSNTLSASNNNHHNESNNKANKVHACAICGAEFSSGQALGGHMRRHRPIATSSGGSPAAQSASKPAPPKNLLCLDLNLPAADEEEHQPQQIAESPKFIFASSEKTLVFANSLVDCRY